MTRMIQPTNKSTLKYGQNKYAKATLEYVQLVPPIGPDGGTDPFYTPQKPILQIDRKGLRIPDGAVTRIDIFEPAQEPVGVLDTEYHWDHMPFGNVRLEVDIVDNVAYKSMSGDGPILFDIPATDMLKNDILLSIRLEDTGAGQARERRDIPIWEDWDRARWLNIAEKLTPIVIHSDEDVSDCSSVENWFFKSVDLSLDLKGSKVNLSYINDLQEEYFGERVIATTKSEYGIVKEQTTHDISLSFDVERYKKGDWNTKQCYLHIKTYSNRKDVDFQYWFFWPYNGTSFDHPCDWEHITVKVIDEDMINIENNQSNLVRYIDSIYFSQHGGGELLLSGNPLNVDSSDNPPYYFTNISKLEWENNHFKAYCAKDSHGFYRSADTWHRRDDDYKGIFKGVIGKIGIGTDNTSIPKNKSYIWNINKSHIEFIAHSHINYHNPLGFVKLNTKNWPWFIGRWGQPIGILNESGPTGPGTKEAWYSNWDSDEK